MPSLFESQNEYNYEIKKQGNIALGVCVVSGVLGLSVYFGGITKAISSVTAITNK